MIINAGTNSIEVFNAADQLTIASTIVGNGLLQKPGPDFWRSPPATITPAAPSFKTAPSCSAASTALAIATASAPAWSTLINGSLSLLDLQASYAYNYNFLIVPGGTGRIDCDGRSSMNGNVTNYGTLTVMTPYVRTDFNGNWSVPPAKLTSLTTARAEVSAESTPPVFPTRK